MQYWKKAAALCAIMVTAGGVAMAAEPVVYTLGPVVVTANRTETPELDTNADVTVVTREEIQENHYQDVTDAIKSVPGVYVADKGANGQNYMSNSLAINGSSNIVMLVDGVRQNINGTTIGSHAMAGTFVNMDSIERIEVLKGAASTLYGSDAQGGVINIITRKPKDGEINSQAGIAFGSYDGEKYNLYHEGSKDGFFWTVDAQKQLQDDFKDGWDRTTISHLNSGAANIKFGKDLGNDSSVVFNYATYDLNYTNPQGGTLDSKSIDGTRNYDKFGLKYDAKITDNLKNQFNVYRNTTEFNENGDPANYYDAFHIKTKTVGLSDQLTYTKGDHIIVGGVDYHKDKVLDYFGAGNDTATSGKSISNTAFYVQDIWDITSKWNLTPGIRLDHNSRYGNKTSPSLVLGYKANEHTNYYVSYKKFFIAPDLFQLYGDSTVYGYRYKGNANLSPETGYTVEAGVHRQFSDSLYGTLSVYRQDADNRIAFVQVGPMEYENQNTGSLKSWGWNAELKKEFNEHVTASAGYTYTNVDAVDPSKNGNFDGTIPESTIHINVDYHNANLTASINGRGIMNRQGNKTKYGTPIDLSDYGNFWVWDVAANYAVTPQATIYARINNIFDQFYTDSIGSSYPDESYWYSAPGRNFEAGVQFKF